MNPEISETESSEKAKENAPRSRRTGILGNQRIELQEGFELGVCGTEDTVTFSLDDLCVLRWMIEDWKKLSTTMFSIGACNK